MSRKNKGSVVKTLVLLSGLALAASLYDSNTRIVTETFELAYEKLPKAFDGFKIAHLSDMHANRFGKDGGRLSKAVKTASPDIIAITGDMFERDGQLGILQPQLEALLDIAPVYYVSGNHEWRTDDVHRCFRMLEEIGVRALRNEFDLLEMGGERIILAGVDDELGPYDQKSPAELMSEIRDEFPDEYVILLAHRPDHFPLYASLGYDTVLSGHIHGGMLRLPKLGGIFGPGVSLFPEYTEVLHKLGNSDMLVSKGLSGVSCLPRAFNPPHLPVLTLRGI